MVKIKLALFFLISLLMLSSDMLYTDDFSDAMIKVKKKLKENTDNSEQSLTWAWHPYLFSQPSGMK